MRDIFQSNRFKKNWKRMQKRGASPQKLATILSFLAEDISLPARCRPHKLSGNWEGFWECHIEPDWLLVYDLDTENELTLVATGTHADLFE